MISIELPVAIYLCGLLLAGYGVSSFIRRISPLERFGFAAALGPGIAGLCLIGISMLGHSPSVGIIVTVCIVLALPGISLFRSSAAGEAFPASRVDTRWKIFCLVAIGYAIFAVSLDAIGQPTIEWDAFAIWQLKAKVLAHEALFPRPAYFSNLNLSFSHLRYPILIPMISAGVHAMSGALTDGLEKAPAILLFLALGATVYATARRCCSATAALTATALLMTTPMMLRFAGSGTAEIGIASFWACSIAALLRWQESRSYRDLLAVALFSACLAWTKNEGLALAVINVLVMLFCTASPFSKRNLTATATAAIIIAVLYAPWAVYVHGLPRTDEDYAGHLNAATIFANLSRLPQIIGGLLLESIHLLHWGLFWMLLIVLTIWQRRRLTSRPVATLWILLLLHFGSYIVAYLITPDSLEWLLKTTVHRLLLNASPAAALLIAYLWPSDTRGSGNADIAM